MNFISDPKYWVKISYDRNSDDIIKVPFEINLDNVSSDFVKGIYFALHNPITNRSYYNIKLESNLCLHNCIRFDIVGKQYITHFPHYYDANVKSLFEKDHIYHNPQKFNLTWKNRIKEMRDGIIQNPSKYFFAIVQVNATYYTIQFESIDFLNGYETMRLWIMKNNLGKYWSDGPYYEHYLQYVFEKWQICKLIVTYQHSEEDNKIILKIFEHINKYLPNNLTHIVVKLFMNKCSDYEQLQMDDDSESTETNDDTIPKLTDVYMYDECHTLCLGNGCHIHNRNLQNKEINLNQCIPKIKLEQIKPASNDD